MGGGGRRTVDEGLVGEKEERGETNFFGEETGGVEKDFGDAHSDCAVVGVVAIGVFEGSTWSCCCRTDEYD